MSYLEIETTFLAQEIPRQSHTAMLIFKLSVEGNVSGGEWGGGERVEDRREEEKWVYWEKI